MSQKQKQQEYEINTNKPTKHYDAVSLDVRKLLSASAQTFIPKLCDALRKDWAPDLSDEQIRRQLKFQKLIRNKIYKEWSKEGGYSEDNIWLEATINLWFPKWLRNPVQQDSTQGVRDQIRQAKIERKSSISDREKSALEKLITNMPKTVIIPEHAVTQRQEIDREDHSGEIDITDEKMHEMGMGTYGSDDRTILFLISEIKGGAERCFRWLCDNKRMPFVDEDLLVDYIKPTREYRAGLALELSPSDRADLHNVMHNLIEICEDMIEQIDKADKK